MTPFSNMPGDLLLGELALMAGGDSLAMERIVRHWPERYKPLEWTSDVPKVDGRYLWRSCSADEGDLVKVAGGFRYSSDYPRAKVENIGGEWAGPIALPREPKLWNPLITHGGQRRSRVQTSRR